MDDIDVVNFNEQQVLSEIKNMRDEFTQLELKFDNLHAKHDQQFETISKIYEILLNIQRFFALNSNGLASYKSDGETHDEMENFDDLETMSKITNIEQLNEFTNNLAD